MKIVDVEPNITREQEREIALMTLDFFDGDWCFILTGLSRTFNQKSEKILNLQDRVEKLRRRVGKINNERISRWQSMTVDGEK